MFRVWLTFLVEFLRSCFGKKPAELPTPGAAEGSVVAQDGTSSEVTPVEVPMPSPVPPKLASEVPVVNHTSRTPWAFYEALAGVERRRGYSAIGLMQICFSESGVDPHAWHPLGDDENHGAFGLTQLLVVDGLDNLRGVGWTQGGQAFRQLTADGQLPYVERYFVQRNVPRGSAGAQLYLANYEPAHLAHAFEPHYVLDHEGSAAYAENSGAFDPPRDANGKVDHANGTRKGFIEVDDLRRRLEDVCHGAVWDEHMARLRYAQGGGSLVSTVLKAGAAIASFALFVGGATWLAVEAYAASKRGA